MNFVLTRYKKKCRKYLFSTARHTAYLTNPFYIACRISAGETETIVPAPSRRMKWPEHEALLGEQRNTYRVLIKESAAKLTFRML